MDPNIIKKKKDIQDNIKVILFKIVKYFLQWY